MLFQNLQVLCYLLAGKQINNAVWNETRLYFELYNVIVAI